MSRERSPSREKVFNLWNKSSGTVSHWRTDRQASEAARAPATPACRQRIDLQYKLPYLDRAQVGEYIKSHLAYAGAEHDIFSDNAVDEIFRFSSGIARLINKVCTHCLLYGAQKGRRIIDDHMVKLVVQGELS